MEGKVLLKSLSMKLSMPNGYKRFPFLIKIEIRMVVIWNGNSRTNTKMTYKECIIWTNMKMEGKVLLKSLSMKLLDAKLL